MKRSCILIAIGTSVFACPSCSSGPPIKAASGEVIEAVTYQERFPPSPDPHEAEFRGDRLRKAVELMDRAGVIGMEGSYTSTGGQDKSTLVLTVRGADQRNRTVIVKGCAEPHVCAFFAAAVKADLVDKAPAACTDGIRCIEVEERTPQDPHQFVPKKP